MNKILGRGKRSTRNAVASSSNSDRPAFCSDTATDEEIEILRQTVESGLLLESNRFTTRESIERHVRREEAQLLQTARENRETFDRVNAQIHEEYAATQAAIRASMIEQHAYIRMRNGYFGGVPRTQNGFGSGGGRASSSSSSSASASAFPSAFSSGEENLTTNTSSSEDSRGRSESRGASCETHNPNRMRNAVRTAVRRSREMTHIIPSVIRHPSVSRYIGREVSPDVEIPEISRWPAEVPVGMNLYDLQQLNARTWAHDLARLDRAERCNANKARRRTERRQRMMTADFEGRRIPPEIDPAEYSLSIIRRRSREEVYPRGPFTRRGQNYNQGQLQRAIHISAQQYRDEEEEAVQRSRGVPTYEEACASKRYVPRPGMRYIFQGPNTFEIQNEEGRPTRMKIVGDMDLLEAMRIANRQFNKARGRQEEPRLLG